MKIDCKPERRITSRTDNNIINLENRLKSAREYTKCLGEIIGELAATEEELSSAAINLAVLDKWREWNESMPVGSEYTFTDEMLYGAGDSNIRVLMNLRDSIAAAVEALNYNATGQ